MLTLFALIAFVVGLVVHEAGGEVLGLDWAGWLLVGLALFAAASLFDWAPAVVRRWRDRP